MKSLAIGIAMFATVNTITPQVNAMEINVIDIINSSDRNVLVEEMVIEASTGNREITIGRAENNIPNRNLQTDREYEPIDCFGNLSKPRQN